MTNWLFVPPWGVRTVALAGLALAALSAARVLRERRAAPVGRQAVPFALRLLLVAALLFIVLNPTALLPRVTPGKPPMIVLVDTSGSMSTRDAGRPAGAVPPAPSGGESRLTAALRVLRDEGAMAGIEAEFAPLVRRFDKTSRDADVSALEADDARGEATELGSALVEAVTDQAGLESQAGVLVISDGRETAAPTSGPDAGDAARLALARSVPLWTWCLGGEVPRRDVWIETTSSEVLAFAGEEARLAAMLHQTGYDARSFTVEVLADGEAGLEVIDRKEVVPDASGRARVETTVSAPAAGERRVVFRAAAQADEADTGNNERAVFLRAVGEKVRVLVAEGEPHWDTKFLVQSLKRDEHVDLTAVYRLGPKRFFAVVSAEGKEQRREERDLFPQTAEDMSRYDVVILGRGCESFFDEGTEGLLTEFVAERGGGLVFSRGKAYGGRFAALAKLEPVAWSDGIQPGVSLDLTPAGRDSPLFQWGGELGLSEGIDELVGRLPRLDRARMTTGEKPLAVVLADARPGHLRRPGGERTIVMAYHRYGLGKVLTVNASGLWRWAFRDGAREDDERVHARFWLAVLRWMIAGSDFVPGASVAFRSERRRCTDEQPMRFAISTRGLDGRGYRPRLVVATGAGDVAAEIDPKRRRGGGYSAEAGPFPPGTYEVTLVSNVGRPERITTTIEVVTSSIEKRVLSADPELMRRLAETSGGSVLTARDVQDMPGVFRRWRASRQTAVDRRTIWDEGWILAAIVGIMGVEWYLRRREGLL